MLTASLLTLLGFVLLFAGAELLVRGAAGLAVRLGMVPLIVGLTIVAYGTSSPELLVSVKAALDGSPGIAVGNVIGSNIFNIAVILGIAALIRPVAADTAVVRRDGPILVAVTGAALLVLADGAVTRLEGGLLLAGSVGYTIWLVRSAHRETSHDEEVAKPVSPWLAGALITGGLVLLAFGSRFLVDGAVMIARGWGVSEAVIGLTIIAAGTSMPELATSAIGALRKQSDIALGNVVGSNLFNILFVLGLAAVIHPIRGVKTRPIDAGFALGLAILLMPLLWTGARVNRLEGALLLASYGAYLALMWPR